MPGSVTDKTIRADPAGWWIRPGPRERIWSTVIIVGLCTTLCWGVILSGNMLGRGASDDLLYHWPAIQQFAHQLPSPDLSDYQSATTPGYHLLLAPLVAGGMGHTGVQLVASLWTLALLGLMAWIVSGRFGLGAVPLMLPMIASVYVLYQGIWLLPDNAGWLVVLLILLLQLRKRSGPGVWVLSGALLVGLVWLRQIHIWMAGVVWLSAWIGSEENTPRLQDLFSPLIPRLGRTTLAIACTVPAFAALGWFMLLWGGLVPPTFQDQHQGPNPATPGFILTQLTILSVFFAPLLLPRLVAVWNRQRGWVLAAGAMGLVLGLIPESLPTIESGRYSGWWHFIGMAPGVMGRSPIFVLGSLLGGVCCVTWLSFADRRDAWIWAGLMLAFVVAQSANHASWQRYHEPMLLIVLLLILARSQITTRQATGAMVSSVLISMMLGAITIGSMVRAGPVNLDRLDSTRIGSP